MKKLLQVSILFVFALVMVSAVFTPAVNGLPTAAAAGCTPVVYASSLQIGVDVSPTYCVIHPILDPPIFRPNVGWNG